MQLWELYRWEILISFIVVVVALLSFGLGYSMAQDGAHAQIIIEKHSE